MLEIFRDSPVGTVLRLLTKNRTAPYPEQLPTFELLSHMRAKEEQIPTPDSISTNGTADATVVVDWYSADDQDNPHNWSTLKKTWVSFLLLIYSFSAYIGSSIYTSSIPSVVQKFGVSEIAASLGLSLYVLAYSIGPLIWTPLSEIPAVGRNPQYIITYMLFVVLCVPTALVDNFAGLLVLRFLLGLMCSPCLATAGASYADFFGARVLPYVIALWGGGATLGPVRPSTPPLSTTD